MTTAYPTSQTAQLRKAHVAVLVGGPKLVVRKVCVADRLDQGPVSSHGTVQEPVPAEPYGLDRESGNPNCGEQVSSPATNDRDSPDVVATLSKHQRPQREKEDDQQQLAPSGFHSINCTDIYPNVDRDERHRFGPRTTI